MSLPGPVSSPADTTVMLRSSVPAQNPPVMPYGHPSRHTIDKCSPCDPHQQQERAPQTPGPWLRRKGWESRQDAGRADSGWGAGRMWDEELSCQGRGEATEAG